jgi:hypothetical protein
MTASKTSTGTTHVLGRYALNGVERELVAVQVPDGRQLRVIDVRRSPLPEDGDLDERHVEPAVASVDEARAIAADYISLAEQIAAPPMPDVWW